MESAGILFCPSRDGTINKIALLETGRSPLRDNTRHRSALGHTFCSRFRTPPVYPIECLSQRPAARRITTISERLLKLTLRKYKHVVFWEDTRPNDEELE